MRSVKIYRNGEEPKEVDMMLMVSTSKSSEELYHKLFFSSSNYQELKDYISHLRFSGMIAKSQASRLEELMFEDLGRGSQKYSKVYLNWLLYKGKRRELAQRISVLMKNNVSREEIEESLLEGVAKENG